MSKMLAMAIPILPGKEEAWHQFMNEIKTKYKEEFLASRKKMNVRERTFIQKTPMGSMVIVTMEGENPETAFPTFAQGTDEFTTWFLQQAQEIHGMDLRQPPPGPLPEMIIDSEAA